MDKTLQELRKLRENTKKEIATKMICIVEYCKVNGFDNILDLDRLKINEAYSGVYIDMLIIDKKVDYLCGRAYSINFGNFGKDDIENVVDCICTSYGKCEEYNGEGINYYWHYEPTIDQCKKWIDKKINKLAELQGKEIDELKEILNDLQKSH